MKSTAIDTLFEIMHKCEYELNDDIKPFEITAENFHEFAIEDLNDDSNHSRINALGNIKRSIECRIDEILFAGCLHVKSEKENWSFPKKIKVLEELGILAPRLLQKINRKRNLLEHQYELPAKEDVEDALDVATLFLGYSRGIIQNTPHQYGFNEEGNFKISIERQNKSIIIQKSENEKIIRIDSNDCWIDFAKLLLEGFPFSK